MTAQRLSDRGFAYVGEWRTADSRVHRVDWIRHKAGVYAFVVDDVVCYIGKADKLHRRLRNYSRRAFGVDQLKERRACHEGIAASLAAGRVVAVYAILVQEGAELTNLELETALRAEFLPLWDRGPLLATRRP